MRCPACGFDNPTGLKFCGGCGAPLRIACGTCGFDNPPRFRFCGECGASLASGGPPRQPPVHHTPKHLAERLRAEAEALDARGGQDGERKTITALFADIKGSMELIELLDPEDAGRIVDPALQLMMDAVHRYDGYVAQSMGDGIFALFGAPLANEDHAQRALYAALSMQEAGRRHAEQLRRDRGINLQIRIGINTGEVIVRSIRKDDLHTDYVPVGHSTGLAARMEALATPGSIFVSEHTWRLTDGYFEFRDLGPAQVKGVSQPLRIFELLGVGPESADSSAVLSLTREGLALCEAQGFVQRRAQLLVVHGWALAADGQPGEGIHTLHEALAEYRATGARLARPNYLAMLAEACIVANRGAEGLEAVTLALDDVGRTSQRAIEAELHRLRGELLLRTSRVDGAGEEAERCFERAKDMAQRQAARSFELRAAMSLARRWRAEGRTAKARELVHGVYLEFTEGFDTPDLRDAATLVQENLSERSP